MGKIRIPIASFKYMEYPQVNNVGNIKEISAPFEDASETITNSVPVPFQKSDSTTEPALSSSVAIQEQRKVSRICLIVTIIVLLMIGVVIAVGIILLFVRYNNGDSNDSGGSPPSPVK